MMDALSMFESIKHDYDVVSDYQVVIHHIQTSSKNCDTPCGHLVLNQVYLNPTI
jgi:hypothetical protein